MKLHDSGLAASFNFNWQNNLTLPSSWVTLLLKITWSEKTSYWIMIVVVQSILGNFASCLYKRIPRQFDKVIDPQGRILISFVPELAKRGVFYLLALKSNPVSGNSSNWSPANHARVLNSSVNIRDRVYGVGETSARRRLGNDFRRKSECFLTFALMGAYRGSQLWISALQASASHTRCNERATLLRAEPWQFLLCSHIY